MNVKSYMDNKVKILNNVIFFKLSCEFKQYFNPNYYCYKI